MSEEPVWFGRIEPTALGQIWVAADAIGLIRLAWQCDETAFIGGLRRLAGARPVSFDPARLAAYTDQVARYLAGTLRVWEIPIDWDILPDFHRRVLQIVARIPYGSTRTYGEIAAELGQPGAARAVGRANATNPMPLVIPCHRVLDSQGRLHGYGYGLATKAWLLALEGRPAAAQLTLW